MEEKKVKALIFSYFLSRLDKQGYIALGYGSFTDAFQKMGFILDENPNNLKNMRDEFDPYFSNNRVGWHQRPLRSSRKIVYEKLAEKTDEELIKLVKGIIAGYNQDDVEKIIRELGKSGDMLRNLHDLIEATRRDYINSFSSEDVQLSEEFKNTYSAYLRDNGQNISYEKTTAIITTAANLKIFAPNQWFVIASYVVDLVRELKCYKDFCEKIVSRKVENVSAKKEYIKKMKEAASDSDKAEFLLMAKEYFKSMGLNEAEIENNSKYLLDFVSNYTWWSGSKTIDRGDYYVSPVLNLLGVVNVSQSYIADIAYNFANVPELSKAVENITHRVEEDNVKVYDPGTLSNYMRKKGGQNMIIYGAPGTGKSRKLEDMFGYAPLTRRAVFHPEYTYFDFVGTYKPVPIYKISNSEFTETNGQRFVKGEPFIDYRYVPGPFIKVLIESYLDPDNMHTLLIEEINRANAAAVFGEIFQLLDRNNDGSSEYSFQPSADLEAFLISEGIGEFIKYGLALPSNMNIVATMNSADQGVSIIDSAFKRRWNFKYIPIDIDNAVHKDVKIRYGGNDIKWGSFLSTLNEKLKSLRIDEDKLIGPYFIKPDELNNRSAIDKLLLYLWDDVLRHRREQVFKNDIRSFSDLSDKFEENDVLSINELIIDYYSNQSNEEINNNEALEETQE